MKKHVEKQIISGKRYKDIVSVKASTKKEKQILDLYKYNCIKCYGHYADIDTSLLPLDDNVNGYIWPDNVSTHGFDYDCGVRIPSNLEVINAVYSVKNPVRAAKWRKRHGVKVTKYTEGDEVWGYTVYHIPSFK